MRRARPGISSTCRRTCPESCEVERVADRSLLALQGPAACEALSALVPSAAAMRFMDAALVAIDGADCVITRSGYTGEDGFEISLPNHLVQAVAESLLAHPTVRLIGLGARDSLRLEAGLCLYGHDLATDITPVEAGLSWAIQAVRRADGMRAGGFPGADVIVPQLTRGRPDGGWVCDPSVDRSATARRSSSTRAPPTVSAGSPPAPMGRRFAAPWRWATCRSP